MIFFLLSYNDDLLNNLFSSIFLLDEDEDNIADHTLVEVNTFNGKVLAFTRINGTYA